MNKFLNYRRTVLNSVLGIFLCAVFSNSFANHTAGEPPQVAKIEEVSDCQYLDTVKGDSGFGKKADWHVIAKYAALSKAEELSASHIVWQTFDSVGAFNGVAVAKAYHC